MVQPELGDFFVASFQGLIMFRFGCKLAKILQSLSGGKAMSLRCVPSGDLLTIFLTDPKILDAILIDQIHLEIVKTLDEAKPQKVLLNFNEVLFLSSAALGMLILVNKKCREFKINLKLCNIKPEITQIFKITGMNKIFAIYRTAEEACAAFRKEESPVQE
jgi:anti-anti-sigma factor